jgi:hypothetical protein
MKAVRKELEPLLALKKTLPKKVMHEDMKIGYEHQ